MVLIIRLRIDIDAQLVENGHGILGTFFSHRPRGRDLGVTPQPDIVHNIALQSLIQLLMNHGHAIFQRLFASS